ncbi:Bax inhibitor-1/YccA family protein [Nocardioides jishulii]|uniref:Bax inhibitor-1/YccA family protein n=1 Tax=Nocardioides jishulii TaxID=2575440 RepID=A0A4U2YHL7_9ACTN|nr:Bax inhibitor-1/YccA family protein [Nocardioides jishulii]QCX26670.1 Bax inhibitor-1/YccA family protein [Nocardioides jishulii]TKI60360.1 Bax inhibitor-1/YccA family protein [Nocardioides jishulii]
MRSNNPVFNRSEAFNGSSARTQSPYGQSPYGQADPYGQYGDPSQWGTGAPTQQAPVARMTIDSVVQKTGITLAVVIVTAMATWLWAGDASTWSAEKVGQIEMAAMAGCGLAFVLSLVNSFKRVVSPALVLAFAAAEGVALGAISVFFENMFPGIVTNAVLGTMAAFAGTLAAYKFFDIKLSDKFKRGVMAVVLGMVGLSVLSLVLSFAGIDMGLFGGGPIGFIFAVLGLVMGVFMLLMDFDFVEQGVAAGIEERNSWTAAFAMTVSLVWIYTNLLRLLAFFQDD